MAIQLGAYSKIVMRGGKVAAGPGCCCDSNVKCCECDGCCSAKTQEQCNSIGGTFSSGVCPDYPEPRFCCDGLPIARVDIEGSVSGSVNTDQCPNVSFNCSTSKTWIACDGDFDACAMVDGSLNLSHEIDQPDGVACDEQHCFDLFCVGEPGNCPAPGNFIRPAIFIQRLPVPIVQVGIAWSLQCYCGLPGICGVADTFSEDHDWLFDSVRGIYVPYGNFSASNVYSGDGYSYSVEVSGSVLAPDCPP